MTSPLLERSALLLGDAAMQRLAHTRVILFGLGGVGSWCAEALVRSGLGHLTIVDGDAVQPSNVNRQLQATPATVGQPKALALQRRLREICPDVDVEARVETFGLATRASFELERFDYVIDAIDSLSNKLGLIEAALASGRVLFSAMGAAAKLDPTRVRVSSIWQTRDCPLARRIRKRLRRHGVVGDYLCVHSDEPVPTHARVPATDDDAAAGVDRGAAATAARTVHGTAVHVTATFGLVLGGLVVQDVVRRCGEPAAGGADAAG